MNRRSPAAAAVAAAFLGPGTVTACTRAGVAHGFTLIWVLGFSLVALLLAQEFCARLGVAGRRSLSEGLSQDIPNGALRLVTRVLVIGAVGIGCAAYEAGNLRGGAQGLLVFGDALDADQAFVVVSVAAAAALAASHRLDRLLKVLLATIVIMTLSFGLAAVLSKPDLGALWIGLSQPSLPAMGGREAFLLVAGLVGTTLVPYNLFLHSSLARDRTSSRADLPAVRREILLYLPLGVLLSMAVLVVGASLSGTVSPDAELSTMSRGLEEPLGRAGGWVFGLGLLCAGLSSALTAPVAAGLAISQLVPGRPRWLERAVLWAVLAIGVASGVLDRSPTQVILFAQIANAALLPIALGFLVWAVRRPRLGADRAGPIAWSAGLLLVALSVALSIKTVIATDAIARIGSSIERWFA